MRPASRRLAANISSCTSAIARIARWDMSASDAIACFETLGGSAFVKPLTGSRGDFAQAIHGEAALVRYLDEVTKYYDAVLIQPIVEGIEYRVFLLDDDALYCARKYPPSVTGDGVHSFRELLAAHNDALRARGLSPASMPEDPSLDAVPAKGERRDIPGRMNLSAGGTMVMADPPSGQAVTLARRRPARWGFASLRSTCSSISAASRTRSRSSRSIPTRRSGCWKIPIAAT